MNARIRKLAQAMLTLGLAIGGPAHAVPADFADPLDTPAAQSALAAQGLFTGLARAGVRIVAVGQRGHILYSDDQGQSWKQAAVPVSSDLLAVSFPTATDGWAVGHDGVVLVSHDGGANWSKQLDGRTLGPLLVDFYNGQAPQQGLGDEALARLRADAQRLADEGPDKPFLDVWFEDAQRGFVVGAFNLVLRTENGGASWQPWLHRTENPRALHLYAIRAVGEGVVIVGEQGLVLTLDRAALRFQALPLPYKGTLFGADGDAGALLVYGLRGNAFRSTDGGVQWVPVTTGSPVSLTASTHAADRSLILVGQTGQVLRSTDGGATLDQVSLEQRVPAAAVLGLSDDTLLLAGPRGLRRVSLTHVSEERP